MENSSYALVLTGSVLPSHTPETVWPALAAYFRMDQDKLRNQLLSRAPLAIKQGDDLGKLQTLLEGVAGAGAEAEICAPDGRPGMFVMLDNAPRGPVPRVFVDDRIEYGLWSPTLIVAEVGSSQWKPYSDFVEPVTRPAPIAVPPAEAAPDPFAARDAVTRVATPATHLSIAGGASGSFSLPVGAAIEAGFWRRCAAMLIDAIILGVIGWLCMIVGTTMRANWNPQVLAGAVFGLYALQIVLYWMYFAVQESSPAQATLGKRALGIKVTDEHGRRIGFARASGRFFGKIISGALLYIGFMLAGWTARKQALHDLMANTLVVFRDVKAGEALPTTRPPMPWYGWLLNGLLIALVLSTLIATALSLGPMIDFLSRSLHAG